MSKIRIKRTRSKEVDTWKTRPLRTTRIVLKDPGQVDIVVLLRAYDFCGDRHIDIETEDGLDSRLARIVARELDRMAIEMDVA